MRRKRVGREFFAAHTVTELSGWTDFELEDQGRLSNEATFLYQLWVREFGTNNLPDCSNTCHEASGQALAEACLGASRTVISWRLGLTQQDHGGDTVREIVNLLMLRGNLGRAGAGPSPVRGHSNVQASGKQG